MVTSYGEGCCLDWGDARHDIGAHTGGRNVSNDTEPRDRLMKLLHRAADAVDRVNDAMGSAIAWLTLLMILFGAYNAVARWGTRYVGVSLSSNALNELQWYLFSIIFLLGAAWGLRHNVHVRVDVLYGRLSERTQAWIDLLGSLLFLIPLLHNDALGVLACRGTFVCSARSVARSWWSAALADQGSSPGLVYPPVTAGSIAGCPTRGRASKCWAV